MQQARELNPLTIERPFEMSVIEQRAGNDVAARAALEQAVRLQPENARTWLRLAELSSTCSTARPSRSTRSGPRFVRGRRRRSTRSSTPAGRSEADEKG